MKSKLKNNILIVIALIISFVSCKDENVIHSVNQQNLQSSHDYLLFEKTLFDIEREIEHALIATGTTKLDNYECVNISFPEFFDKLKSITS